MIPSAKIYIYSIFFSKYLGIQTCLINKECRRFETINGLDAPTVRATPVGGLDAPIDYASSVCVGLDAPLATVDLLVGGQAVVGGHMI